jgi:ATPases involved in chromosome partitioning
MAIKITIADDVIEMREMISKMLASSEIDFEIVGLCENGQEVLDQVKKEMPDIILMDINMPVMNGLEATEALCQLYPEIAVIMMSVQHESEYLKKAMLAGAKAYIMKPVDMDELLETINVTHDRNRALVKTNPTVSKLAFDANVVTFFSAKGGVGKTMIALNMSLLISEKFNKKVLLLDLDLQFGDIALMVNKQSEMTIKELFDDSPINTIEDIKPYLYKFKDNCDMLFAPKDPEAAEYLSKEQIKHMIEILKKNYDVIIIDTGVNFDEVTLNALDVAEHVVVVSNMEVTGLKNTKLSLKVMQSLNYDNNKVKLLVNLTNEKFGVTKSNIQKAFSFDVLGYLPEDVKGVRNSINTGVPFVLGRNSSLYKPLLNICHTIID